MPLACAAAKSCGSISPIWRVIPAACAFASTKVKAIKTATACSPSVSCSNCGPIGRSSAQGPGFSLAPKRITPCPLAAPKRCITRRGVPYPASRLYHPSFRCRRRSTPPATPVGSSLHQNNLEVCPCQSPAFDAHQESARFALFRGGQSQGADGVRRCLCQSPARLTGPKYPLRSAAVLKGPTGCAALARATHRLTPYHPLSSASWMISPPVAIGMAPTVRASPR